GHLLEHLLDPGEHVLDLGQHLALERRGIRDRRVLRGYANGRGTQRVPGLVDDARDDLAREAAGARSLTDDDEAPGPANRLGDRLEVERLERPHVDHLDLDLLAGEL